MAHSNRCVLCKHNFPIILLQMELVFSAKCIRNNKRKGKQWNVQSVVSDQ